jgi:hypothetical protein
VHASRTVLLALVAFSAGCVSLGELDGWDCVHGSGKAVSQPRFVSYFDEVDASGDVTVLVSNAEAVSVVVEAEDNIVDGVATTLGDGRLDVRWNPGCLRNVRPVTVKVSMPNVKALSAGPQAKIIGVGDLVSQDLKLAAARGGTVTATADAGRLIVTAVNGGLVTVGGRASNYTAFANSKGQVRGYGLMAGRGDVTAQGSGIIEASAAEALSVTASTGGRVFYKGGGDVNFQVSSDSSAKRTG